MDILLKKLNKYNTKYSNKNKDIYLLKINYYENLINQYGGLQKVFTDIKENVIRLNANQANYTQSSVNELINNILDLAKKENQTKINELEILNQELQKLRKIKVTSSGDLLTSDLSIIPEEKKEEIKKIKIQLADIDNDPEKIINLLTQIIIQNIASNENKSLVQIMANLIILNKEVKIAIKNKLIEELPKYNLNYSNVNISIRNILDERMYRAI